MFGRRWFRGHHGCGGYEAAAACGPMKYGGHGRWGGWSQWGHEGPGGEENKEYAELRSLVFETIEAATQVARGNQPELVGKATEVLKDARKRLYELLAQKA